uniref:Uncharacterized protein n=1 Tax=Abalone asfa-like virus TaxID=2839893 RepID=A0A5K7Y386_9VIRU|nr:hypothetical protein [Abalone asfa-like virus]BCY04593.1 hypothetical protein [Abalone asfa-like virus]
MLISLSDTITVRIDTTKKILSKYPLSSPFYMFDVLRKIFMKRYFEIFKNIQKQTYHPLLLKQIKTFLKSFDDHLRRGRDLPIPFSNWPSKVKDQLLFKNMILGLKGKHEIDEDVKISIY